jgi:hypothetical protein
MNDNEHCTQEGDNLNATKSYSSELFDSSQSSSEDDELRNNRQMSNYESLTSDSNKSPLQQFITTNNYQIDFLLLMHFIYTYSLLNVSTFSTGFFVENVHLATATANFGP